MIREDYDRGIVNVGNQYRFHQVFEKMKNGEEINIVFLGGSITQDCSATVHELCYAYQTYMWFNRRFTNCKINYFNSGIGGTTSQFGLARIEEDVFSHNPDIVFVEFSVNDSNNEFFMETYESLLRKILTSKTKPAVFTFNNVTYDKGENAEEVHNKIGVYYDLPIVSMKSSIYEEILLGNLKAEHISADNLHPNNLGHSLLAECISNLLDIILDNFNNFEVEKNVYEVPEKPITNLFSYETIRYRNELVSKDDFVNNKVIIDDSVQCAPKDCFKKGFIFKEEGSFIEFCLEFKKLSIQYLKKAEVVMPKVALYIDNVFVKELDGSFDEGWDCLFMDDVFDADTCQEHKIKVAFESAPKEAFNPFYLVSFITIE